MHLAVLMAAINPYHPPKHNDAPLDVLLVAIGLVILTLLIVIPAHMGLKRENARLAAEHPAPTAPPETSTTPQ